MLKHTRSREVRGIEAQHFQSCVAIMSMQITRRVRSGPCLANKIAGLEKNLLTRACTLCALGVDQQDELLVANHQSGPYRLQRTPATTQPVGLPNLLSETGLFASLQPLKPAAGLKSYEIEHPRQADGLQSRRWLAMPTDQAIRFRGRSDYPDRTTIVKMLSLGDSGQPIETQIL